MSGSRSETKRDDKALSAIFQRLIQSLGKTDPTELQILKRDIKQAHEFKFDEILNLDGKEHRIEYRKFSFRELFSDKFLKNSLDIHQCLNEFSNAVIAANDSKKMLADEEDFARALELCWLNTAKDGNISHHMQTISDLNKIFKSVWELGGRDRVVADDKELGELRGRLNSLDMICGKIQIHVSESYQTFQATVSREIKNHDVVGVIQGLNDLFLSIPKDEKDVSVINRAKKSYDNFSKLDLTESAQEAIITSTRTLNSLIECCEALFKKNPVEKTKEREEQIGRAKAILEQLKRIPPFQPDEIPEPPEILVLENEREFYLKEAMDVRREEVLWKWYLQQLEGELVDWVSSDIAGAKSIPTDAAGNKDFGKLFDSITADDAATINDSRKLRGRLQKILDPEPEKSTAKTHGFVRPVATHPIVRLGQENKKFSKALVNYLHVRNMVKLLQFDKSKPLSPKERLQKAKIYRERNDRHIAKDRWYIKVIQVIESVARSLAKMVNRKFDPGFFGSTARGNIAVVNDRTRLSQPQRVTPPARSASAVRVVAGGRRSIR